MTDKKVQSPKKESQNHAAAPAVGSDKCRFGSCKHSVNKFGFCQEHFEMYMAGVIRGDGAKPVDFEKKLELFLAARKVA